MSQSFKLYNNALTHNGIVSCSTIYFELFLCWYWSACYWKRHCRGFTTEVDLHWNEK